MRVRARWVRAATAVVVLGALLGVPSTPASAAAVFVVNSTRDAPDTSPGNGACDTGTTNTQGATECTLRAAIEESNALTGADTIDFNIPTTEAGFSASPLAFTLSPTSAYPFLTDQVDIDGSTQPEWTGDPIIQLDGTAATGSSAGLLIQTDNSSIRGLIVHSFIDEGFEIGGPADNNTITNSWVGIDASGAMAGNADYGILVTNDSHGNTIGGTAPNDGLVIGGNTNAGISVRELATSNTRIIGNHIGVTPAGVAIPNGSHGIEIHDTATLTIVGGVTPEESNTIAHNVGDGVAILANAGPDNVVLGNHIHSNGGLGIDLGNDGVTANSGADAWVDHPVITSAQRRGVVVDLGFDIDLPAGDHRIEFFSNPGGIDPSGNGEGQRFLGVKEIIGHPGGVASHTAIMTGPEVNEIITATATEGRSAPFGATSEFSAGVPVTTPADGLLLTSRNNVSSPSGAPGLDSWSAQDIVRFGEPSLALGPTTSGTFGLAFDVGDHTSGGTGTVDGLVQITETVTVGSANAMTVEPGDLLISLASTETFTSTGLTARDEDIVLFEPAVPGKYDSGTASLFVDGSAFSNFNTLAFAFAETTTQVGDATVPAGTVLLTRSGGPDILRIDLTDVGVGTAGTETLFASGSSLGLSAEVWALDLIEVDTDIGGTTIAAGTVLLSTKNDGSTVGSAGQAQVTVDAEDVFGLDIITTGASAVGGAFEVFDGSEVGLDTKPEEVSAITVFVMPDLQLEVNSTGDDGDATTGDGICDTGGVNSEGAPECTLRAAIEESNLWSAAARIDFAIPTSDSGFTASPAGFRISPTSPFDAITNTVAIDGTTQAEFGSIHRPVIELRGTSAGLSHGLDITASNSYIRGLVINDFQQDGIHLRSGASGNVIAGNFFGTDVTGTVGGSLANDLTSLTITNGASANLIGGSAISDRNVFGASGSDNILVGGSGTDSNEIRGNHIGTDVTGTLALGAGGDGIDLGGGADGTLIIDNVISGGGEDGIDIATAHNTTIRGNHIGVDTTGNVALGNPGDGVEIEGTAQNTVVGGSAAHERNVIAANAIGIWVRQVTVGTVVAGNHIGVGADGVTALGNTAQGIHVDNGASNVRIGGTLAGEGNVIAHNSVGVQVTIGTGNAIIGNSIHSNTGLGIDLAPSGTPGVTANDAGDADSGPNDLLNFPVITAATDLAGTVTADFTLDAPAGNYRIEFFSNPGGVDPSGHGEGQVFLGAGSVTHDGDGVAPYAISFPDSAGSNITATATEEFGPTTFGATSEFSGHVRSIAGGLWFTTSDVVTASGAPGLASWNSGEFVSLQNPNHLLEPGGTNGTLLSILDITLFDAAGTVRVNGMHYVTTETTIGSSPSFTVLPGDVLLSTRATATLVSSNSLTVDREDVFVFRPDAVGDYSSGSFLMLLDNPVGGDIRSVSLVHSTTIVGDVALVAGDLLFSQSGGAVDGNIRLFRPTGTGDGTTSGLVFDLIVDTEFGSDRQLRGVALVENDILLGDETVPRGAVLIAVDGAIVAGDNAVAVDEFDIFYLVATTTNLGSGFTTADATLLLDGSAIFLDSADEKIDGIALVRAASDNATAALVNSTGDAADASVGDDVCWTGGTNSQGDPECTLRAALDEVNASTVLDTIRFDLPASEPGHSAGIWTTSPATALPTISAPLVLDATTQPGYGGVPLVRIDGSLAGGASGINVGSTGGNSRIIGLGIQDFSVDGVHVAGGAAAVTIADNWIGSDGTGATAPGNGDDGIDLNGSNAIISGNVVNNNGDEGIDVRAAGATIIGNIVGLEPAGSTGGGNTDVGIAVFFDNTTIGGATAAERNVISMNWEGIEVNSSNNVVQGNHIGTDVGGTLDKGNRIGDGIEINSGNGNLIGGTAAGEGNLIAHNQVKGVDISGGTDNAVIGNRIHSNGALGIDIGPDGITPNDAGDPDAGANDLLNRPVMTSVTESGGTLTVSGTFDVPAGNYRLEVFTNPGGADPSGSGEGEVVATSAALVHTGSGSEGWVTAIPGSIGDIVTTTLTEDLGASHGSTSEFSLAVTAVPANSLPTADAGGPYAITEGDPVTLDGSGSADPDSDPLTYAWDLDNNGSFGDVTGVAPVVSWATLLTFGIADDGSHPIAVRVDDSVSGTATAAGSIVVANAAPIVTVSGPDRHVPGGNVQITVGATDPGTDVITAWTVNWGDGTIEDFAGSPTTASHTYTNSGAYSIGASVTDEDGTFITSALVVSDFDGGSAEEYDANTGAQLRAYPSDPSLTFPGEAATGPDGLLYVSGFTSNTVVRYDPGTGAFFDVFVSAGAGSLSGPAGIEWTPSGDLVVASVNNDSIKRYDGTTGAYIADLVTAGLGGLDAPIDLLWHTSGDLMVTSYNSGQVIRYGPDGSLVGVFATGIAQPAGIDIGTDGDLYVSSDSGGTVEVVDGVTGALTGTFVSVPAPWGLRWGPDGNLWVASATTPSIEVYDEFGALIRTHTTASDGLTGPRSVGFAPDHQIRIDGLVVNSTADTIDASLGDGSCDTGATNSEGDPECTLRAAIGEANAQATTGSISFDIPVSDPGHRPSPYSFTIAPVLALPTMTAPLTLDATTQPGYIGTPAIELDGSSGSAGTGLTVTGSGTTIRGFAVHSFAVGIDLSSGSGTAVETNFVGTDVTGTSSLPNTTTGIAITSANNTVGGGVSARNVISGNGGPGISLAAGATGNTIVGNYIGVATDGTSALPNGGAGVSLSGGATTNVIGGVAGDDGNVISHNGSDAVETIGASTTDNAILGNSMASNGGLGIDLGGDDVDALFPNSGPPPSGRMNRPTLTSLSENAGTVTVAYRLSVPAGDYRVEFFTSTTADPTGFGEGSTFVSADLVTHLGGETQEFGHVFNAGGGVITATVTRVVGVDHHLTSEFSNARSVITFDGASIRDSSARNSNGVSGGDLDASVSVAGIGGRAITFGGGAQRVVGPAVDTTSGALTVSAWFNATTFGTDPRIVSKATDATDRIFDVFVDDSSPTTGEPVVALHVGGGTVTARGGAVAPGAWHHVVAVWTGAALTLYVDGVAVDTVAASGALRTDLTTPTIIGNVGAADRGFQGAIDEVRIEHLARDADWVATTNATLSAPSAFVRVGEIQRNAPAPWTVSGAQTRSGTNALVAPDISLTDAWITASDIDALGVEFEAWWWISTTSGVDLAQGTRTGAAPISQFESAIGPSGRDLGTVERGTRTQNVAPPGGQTPITGAWTKVTVRTDQFGSTSVWVDDVMLIAPTPNAPSLSSGSVGFRAGAKPPSEQWYIDDAIARHYVDPEPTVTLHSIDRQ